MVMIMLVNIQANACTILGFQIYRPKLFPRSFRGLIEYPCVIGTCMYNKIVSLVPDITLALFD